MYGVGRYHPYMAVYAASAVPSRVGLFRVVDTYGHDVLAGTEVGRDVAAERYVSVGAHTGRVPVDKDLREHIYAVKIEIDAFVGCKQSTVYVEVFAIPSYSAGKCTPAGSRWVIGREVTSIAQS